MLLRNFYNALAFSFVGKTVGISFEDGSLKIKGLSGTLYNQDSFYNYIGAIGKINKVVSNTSETPSSDVSYVMFGSGSTPVTFNDYKLDAIITTLTGSSFMSSDPVFNIEANKWTGQRTFTLTNSTANPVTVSEVGIVTRLTSTSNVEALVYREVLETPFTIAAGESVNYAHKFEFTMPIIS